jgi:hypothetical protein
MMKLVQLFTVTRKLNNYKIAQTIGYFLSLYSTDDNSVGQISSMVEEE